MISIQLPATGLSGLDATHSVFSPTRLSPVCPTFTFTDTERDLVNVDQQTSSPEAPFASTVALHSPLTAQLVSAQAARRFKPLKIIISQRKSKKLNTQAAIHKHPNAIPSFQVTMHCGAVTPADYQHERTPTPSPRAVVDHDKTPTQTPRTARPLKRNMEKLTF